MVFDDGEPEGFHEGAKGYETGRIPEQRSDLYGDFLKGFPVQSEECIALLVEKELEHIPGEDYATRLLSRDSDSSVRRDAIDWIGKVGVFSFTSSFHLSIMDLLLGLEICVFSNELCVHGV